MSAKQFYEKYAHEPNQEKYEAFFAAWIIGDPDLAYIFIGAGYPAKKGYNRVHEELTEILNAAI